MSVRAIASVLLLVGCAGGGNISYSSAEIFCAQRGACLPDYIISSLGGFQGYCIEDTMQASGPYRDSIVCAIGAGSDCEAVRNCFGVQVQLQGATCTTTETQCQGDAVVGCIPEDPDYHRRAQLARLDCTTRGGTCLPSSWGGVACGSGTCTASRCLPDGRIENCYGNVAQPGQCPPEQTCREDSSGAHCVAAGEPCAQSLCEGDVVVSCDTEVGRINGRTDCAASGQHCEYATGGYPTCEPTGFQCDPGTTDTRCQDGFIVYCGPDGQLHEFDCTAHGFAGCRTYGSDYPEVVCVPIGINPRT